MDGIDLLDFHNILTTNPEEDEKTEKDAHRNV